MGRLNLDCPMCRGPLTPKTEAARVSPMWASVVRQAKQDYTQGWDYPVGVCYNCGEIFDSGHTMWTDEERARMRTMEDAARTAGAHLGARNRARRLMREGGTDLVDMSQFIRPGMDTDKISEELNRYWRAKKQAAMTAAWQEIIEEVRAEREAERNANQD